MSFSAERQPTPWIAVAGACGIYFAFGLTLGVMAPLVDEISTDLELTRSTMGSILGAWALIYIFTAVPAGAVVDRLGLRWSLTLGGLTIVLSTLLRSIASGSVTLFGAVAVFGIGGPLVSIATPKLIASLFSEDERRFPTGLAVAAPTLGSAVGLAATNPVLLPLVDDSWRGVLAVAAGAAAIVTVGWIFASRTVRHLPHGQTRTDFSTIGRLLRLRSMRWTLTLSLFVFFFSHALSNWLPEILSDAGQSDDAAGYLAAMSTIVGITGALTISRSTSARHRPVVLIGIGLTVAVCVIALGALPFAVLVAALAVMGFARAGNVPLILLEIMGDPDVDVGDIGAATGLFFAVAQIGGFSGPYAVGFVADRTDGFAAATALLAFVAFCSAVSAAGLSRATRQHRATAH